MIDATIRPGDVMKLNAAFKGLKPERVLRGMWLPFVTEVMLEVGEYPLDFAGNTYVRTGNLWTKWHRDVLSPLSAMVENPAFYAGAVHGHEQMAVHAGHGWKHLFDVGAEMLKDFVKKIEAKVDRIWSR